MFVCTLDLKTKFQFVGVFDNKQNMSPLCNDVKGATILSMVMQICKGVLYEISGKPY